MTYHLGISCGLNASAALVKDGLLVAAAAEERFSRKKHQQYTPHLAIQYCLNSEGISLAEVEKIGVGWQSPEKHLFRNFEVLMKHPLNLIDFPSVIGRYNSWRKKKFDPKFFNSNKKKIKHYYHHQSHAASAYHVSGFYRANIITMDGMGEADSTSLSVGEKKQFINLKKVYDHYDSLGANYSAFTGHLGFTPHSHEGKVMGLASYGWPVDDTSKVIKFKEKGYTFKTFHNRVSRVKHILKHGKFLLKYYNRIFDEQFDLNRLSRDRHIENPMLSHFGPRRSKNDKITAAHANMAATIQNIHEKVLIKLGTTMYDNTGIKNFCLAGGSNLNCIANSHLQQKDFCKDIFVQPAAGDDGTSIGAAFLLHCENEPSRFVMDNAYWGPGFSNEEIKKELDKKQFKFKYEYHKDIEGVGAELIQKNKILGWFQGRMEIGPRALGNRSILCNPESIEMRDKVNEKVKHRERWRPFAPSLLLEAAPKYLENPYPSPFMILSSRVIPERWQEIAAVVHIDGTTRPQTVTKEQNPRYHKLIKSFGKLSGTPLVLNTSFNDNEEPIVCTPYDALRTFSVTGMDAVCIGNYLVTKK